MLSVVVDDHDMGVSHVIRGDDHFTNTARQLQIYHAMGWAEPVFAHLPMILGPDGAKLSKRHGALGVDAYRDMGYLPDAMRNYLLRLGWAHGDDEIISTEQAIEWFDLAGIGKSAARFDFAKLENLNGIYMREKAPEALLPELLKTLARLNGKEVDATARARLETALPGLKERATNLVELAKNAGFLFAQRPLAIEEAATKLLTPEARGRLKGLAVALADLNIWTIETIEACIREFAGANAMKLGQVAQPLRAALTGSTTSPGIFDVLFALGQKESVARIRDQST
jgi:glutamyl-tRNA synthetase